MLGISLNELKQGERIIEKKNADSIEIEVKLEVDESNYIQLINFLKNKSTKHTTKSQHDIYFSPEIPKFFGEEESDIHISEYETQVSNLEATINILKGVRINQICEVKKNRDTFIYKDIFEVSLDRVEGLGFFIEIEIYDKNIPIKEANQLLLEFIKEMNLDITRRNLKGYSYLMYDKIMKK